MPKANQQVDMGKASIKFLLVTILVVAVTLLVSILLLWINGSFTLWAIVPLLAGLPVSILINIAISKNTSRSSHPTTGENTDETIE